LSVAHLNPWNHGFNLYSFYGVAFVYLYFQIPLMVLVITPALGGLRPAWREAAENLGASSFRYWRTVGIPVLLPSVLGGMLLLFGSAFAAYATADTLTAGTVTLAPIQIGEVLNGNVISGEENIGYAIGLGMLIVLTITMVLYSLVRRRASRWLR
jgi:putative spermidine/putrescine transport system permease protein